MSEASKVIPEERQTIVSRKIRLRYVVSNGLASVVELSAGFLTGNIAQVVDGVHGAAEISIGNTQMKDAHNQDHVHDTKRKRIFTALCGMSATSAFVAASEIITGNEAGIDSPQLEAVAFGASGVAFASGVAAAIAIRRRVKNKYGAVVSKETREAVTSTERDLMRHIMYDLFSSGMAFSSGAIRTVGNYAGMKYGSQDVSNAVDNSIGFVSGLLGVFLFRPTASNLQHHHNHEHHHEMLSPVAEELVDLREN